MHRDHRTDPRPVSRPLLDRIHRLRLRLERDRAGLHFVEGFRPVIKALEARIPVETLVYSERLAWNPCAQKRVRLARRAGIPVARLTPEEFRGISLTPRASGLGAILRQHWTPLETIDPFRGLCWVAVSRIRSPGNLGTILRTAEAVGAAGALFLGEGSDPFHPAIVRATMGGLFHLQLVRTSLEAFQDWSRRNGCRVMATSPSASALYTEVDVQAPLVVFFGEERRGMMPGEAAVSTEAARIPLVGRADSLNVGVAAGVILYEVLRRAAWFRESTSRRGADPRFRPPPGPPAD